MKKLVFIALMVTLLAAGLIFLFNGDKKEAKRDIAIPVIVVNVTRQAMHDNIEALGTAYANESITITASASETISEINFTDGQKVKAGDVIARLEQREEQADLGMAKARLEEHKRELARLNQLLENRAASQREVDERKTQVDITQQEIKGIEARISDRTLRAPFSGVLGIRRLSVGALVQPGDVITTLDDINLIKLDFSMPAIYLGWLKPGVAIEATTGAHGEERFSGVIDTVDSRIDPTTRSVLVRAILPNEGNKLTPGMLMQVSLLQNQRESLVVPEESVLQKQDKQSVYIVKDDDIVEERPITIGTRIPGFVEVLSGVSEGERVIIRGVNRAKPGDKVTIQETRELNAPPAPEENG